MGADIDKLVLTVAGVSLEVRRVGGGQLDDWRLLTATGVPASTAARYADAQFTELIGELQDSGEHQVVSRWALAAPEFGWPLPAARCGCLADQRLADTAHDLNGRRLFPTPGPVLDHFMIRAELLAVLGGDGDDITADVWLETIGVDKAWMTAGLVEAQSSSISLRKALLSQATSWRRDSLVRSIDVYRYGGAARSAAEALREAYVQRIGTEAGYTYDAGKDFRGVRRRVYSLNSVRLAESVCCTTVERHGDPVFVTELELAARSSQTAWSPQRT